MGWDLLSKQLVQPHCCEGESFVRELLAGVKHAAVLLQARETRGREKDMKNR